MTWLLLVYLLAFMLQAGVLGVSMYTLIQFSDLENDYVNPHEAAANVNRVVLPEYVGQAALALLLVLSGRWGLGILHVCVAAWHARLFLSKQHLTDVTEIFREVGKRKRVQLVQLCFYVVGFCWVVYSLIETTIHATLSPTGRQMAGAILKEAAAALQRRR